ncbi:MAG: hypothetical protein ABFS32_12640 [Bacteroidota bacterium]
MIDKDKVPESTYRELVELMGKEKAEAYMEGELYNYQAIAYKIAVLRVRRFIRKRPLVFILLVIGVIATIVLWYMA